MPSKPYMTPRTVRLMVRPTPGALSPMMRPAPVIKARLQLLAVAVEEEADEHGQAGLRQARAQQDAAGSEEMARRFQHGLAQIE